MEGSIRMLVENIFNNWTAMQLAVEHSMGGPDSRKIALQTIDHVVNFLITEKNIEVEDIEDLLEDVMDQEFNTICEDNSIKEISQLLHNFTRLLLEENIAQFEVEFNKLPTGKQWITQQRDTQQTANISNAHIEPASSDADMETEADPEWTEVKTRRKK